MKIKFCHEGEALGTFLLGTPDHKTQVVEEIERPSGGLKPSTLLAQFEINAVICPNPTFFKKHRQILFKEIMLPRTSNDLSSFHT